MAKALALQMIETFQCPGCQFGENTECGSFKMQELHNPHCGDFPAAFRCESHLTNAITMGGGRLNIGLPIPFARVQYRAASPTKDIPTNIRLLTEASKNYDYWDMFNVPVWAMVKGDYLFVRTYSPRTDQTYVDVIHEGTMDFVRAKFPNVIDIGPFEDRMQV